MTTLPVSAADEDAPLASGEVPPATGTCYAIRPGEMPPIDVYECPTS